MNKVKYPDKKEIQRQICTIIDRSQIFDEKDDSQTFTEVKPVNRTSSYSKAFFAVVKTTASAAAVVLAVFFARGFIKSGSIIGQQAMNTGANSLVYEQLQESASDNTVSDSVDMDLAVGESSGSREQVVNEAVTVKYDKYSRTVMAEGNDTELAFIKVSYPLVYADGEILEYIRSSYELESEQIYLDVSKRYRNYYDETGNKSGDAFVDFNSVYSSCDYLSDNVISFYSNYIENYYNEDISISTVRIYGANFDTDEDRKLSYSDLFVNYDTAMQCIAQSVYNEMKLKSFTGSVREDYLKQENVAARIEQDNNFYFTSNGIVVCCNDYLKSEELENGPVQSAEAVSSVLIPFFELRDNGVIFNTDYINFN